MSRVVPAALVLLALAPQACRDEATAPQPLRSGQVAATSASSSKIAFTSTRDGHSQIYVMNADGSALTRLTNDTAGATWPSWSPDGQHIAFQSTRDGHPEIYVMAADGSNVTQLTTNGYDIEPSWSPDGRRIAFVRDKLNDKLQIWVMNSDGSSQTPLPNVGDRPEYPSWSPDGRQIAFQTDFGPEPAVSAGDG